MKRRILLRMFIIMLIITILVFTGCQKITQEDINRQGARWWVVWYKIREVKDITSTYEYITGMDGIEEAMMKEFNCENADELSEYYRDGDLGDRYRYTKKRVELMEELLIKLRGEGALKEIEGIWNLDEVPDLWEKVNKQETDKN
jgi:hypothetical protein